ncbi:MAG: LysR family transcriptional regulator [Burkholderiales bacterium]
MDIRKVDLNLLVVFDALLRTRNVSRAAEELATSQPAASHALARLRTLLGDPLFVRTSRGIVPTPYAEGLAVPLQEVLDRIRTDLLERPRFDPATARRTFTLGLSDIGELVFLPRLLRHVTREAPGVTIATENVQDEDTMEPLLRAGTVDLAIGNFREPKTALLYQQRLFGHSHVVLVRRDHPGIGDAISERQYVAANHAVVHPGGLTEIDFEEALRRKGIERRVVLSAKAYLAVPAILRATDLVFTVPWVIGKALAEFPHVKMLEPPFPTPRANIRQYWHARFHHDPANQWIRGVIAELFLEERRRAQRGRTPAVRG